MNRRSSEGAFSGLTSRWSASVRIRPPPPRIHGSQTRAKLHVGFATSKVAKQAAPVGINPQRKEKMKIPAKKVVKFAAGKGLKTAI